MRNNLDVMYLKGLGEIENFISAHMWFNLAAIKGLKEAVNGRNVVAGLMSQQQLAQTQNLAKNA